MKQKQLSRKQLRKQRKQQKKQRIQKHHQSKQHFPHPQPQPELHSHKQKRNNGRADSEPKVQRQGQQVSKKVTKKANPKTKYPSELEMEDEEIARYEQKLGIKGNSDKKYGKMAKKMGFDDDLFDFLDGISQKVRGRQDADHPYEREKEQEQEDIKEYEEDEEGSQDFGEVEEQIGEFDEDQLQDMLNQQQLDKYLMEQQEQPKKKNNKKAVKEVQHQQKISTNKKQNQSKTKTNQIKAPPTNSLQTPQSTPSADLEAQKKMNSLFNKLSDGNLLYSFREFISIFESNPKSLTFELFSTLFIKFNLMIEKPLIHIMSSNIVIAASLHRVYGDRFMAKLIYQTTQEFQKLYQLEENLEEIQEIGYSRLFEKKKNFITIVSYLYQFGSISALFPQTLVYHLTNNIADKENIQLIYQVVQKCGVRMRNHDPGTLKQVIQVLKKMIEESKTKGTYQTTKIKFIDLEINEIRFNKKTLFDNDQKMGFLKTFLQKTIKAEMPAQQSTIDVSYDQMKQTQDTNGHEWWLGGQKNTNTIEEQTKKSNKRVQELSQQVKQLYQLAKSMHFVTEIKKNIFVELMSSQDYIQATKRVLELKVKRLEDLVSVLAQVNIQESIYNPFYSLVACKVAEQIPKFRVCFQFGVWDRLKQINTFDARKISNLAKFTAWFVASEEANSSLTLLKYFPDLMNIKSEQDVFLRVFFKELFKKSSKNWIARLSNKLKQQKNKGIRDGIKDYLGQIYEVFESQKQKNNCTLLRKLLAAQFQDQLDIE